MIEIESLLKATTPNHFLLHGLNVLDEKLKPIKVLLEQRRVPDEGIEDDVIEIFLKFLSLMDTDKDPLAARVGEREARVASKLVSSLSAGFNHGVGCSGELIAPQPKAPGSSIMYYFSNKLALDALRRFGLPNIKSAFVMPLATGMTLALTLSAIREKTGKFEVIYPRVDHKSPLKAMRLAGMKVKTLDGIIFGDAVRIPVEDVENAVTNETAVIMSTTTFFPPREPDRIKEIAKIAEAAGVFHIINNAYGIQSREIMRMIRGAIDAGRVDVIIQSTDKNFLTPVGGSVIASPNKEFLELVSKSYVGRATAAPIVQFLAAILTLGVKGYEKLRDEQESNRRLLGERLQDLARKHGERVLDVYNPIAAAVTLTKKKNVRRVGGHLYNLRVMGPHVFEATDFGVCCPKYEVPYVTMNAAIGCKKEDIEIAVQRLDEALSSI